MSNSVANRRDATLRKSFADPCPTAAKAGLEKRLASAPVSTDPMYDHLEAVQRAFDLSEKEMSDLLGIAQSNYTRRTYNVARLQRLPVEMRELFGEYFAAGVGLTVNRATPHEQVQHAAILAIVNLLELLRTK